MTALPRDETFDVAYRELFPRAATLAYRILGDRSAAEDAAAEALARALARWRSVGSLPYRDAWVLRVTTNVAIDVVRRRRGGRQPDAVADDVEAATLRIALADALSSLSRRQRTAVALRYLSGLSEVEVAQSLGVSTSTAKTHIRRGLAALRRRLGDWYEEDPVVDIRHP